jgi:hypothetical protein
MLFSSSQIRYCNYVQAKKAERTFLDRICPGYGIVLQDIILAQLTAYSNSSAGAAVNLHILGAPQPYLKQALERISIAGAISTCQDDDVFSALCTRNLANGGGVLLNERMGAVFTCQLADMTPQQRQTHARLCEKLGEKLESSDRGGQTRSSLIIVGFSEKSLRNDLSRHFKFTTCCAKPRINPAQAEADHGCRLIVKQQEYARRILDHIDLYNLQCLDLSALGILLDRLCAEFLQAGLNVTEEAKSRVLQLGKAEVIYATLYQQIAREMNASGRRSTADLFSAIEPMLVMEEHMAISIILDSIDDLVQDPEGSVRAMEIALNDYLRITQRSWRDEFLDSEDEGIVT